jgi:hypothetical protein
LRYPDPEQGRWRSHRDTPSALRCPTPEQGRGDAPSSLRRPAPEQGCWRSRGDTSGSLRCTAPEQGRWRSRGDALSGLRRPVLEQGRWRGHGDTPSGLVILVICIFTVGLGSYLGARSLPSRLGKFLESRFEFRAIFGVAVAHAPGPLYKGTGLARGGLPVPKPY